MSLRTLTCLGALLLLPLGCASTPEKSYYTLDMTPSGKVTLPVDVTVERLRPAEPLVRREISIKTSPIEVEYYAADEWAAGVDELVTLKLQAELGTRRKDLPNYALTGTIREFGQVDTSDGAAALVVLELELRPEGASRYEPPVLHKVYQVRTPTSRAPEAVVQALSDGVEQIAWELAADIAAMER